MRTSCSELWTICSRRKDKRIMWFVRTWTERSQCCCRTVVTAWRLHARSGQDLDLGQRIHAAEGRSEKQILHTWHCAKRWQEYAAEAGYSAKADHICRVCSKSAVLVPSFHVCWAAGERTQSYKVSYASQHESGNAEWLPHCERVNGCFKHVRPVSQSGWHWGSPEPRLPSRRRKYNSTWPMTSYAHSLAAEEFETEHRIVCLFIVVAHERFLCVSYWFSSGYALEVKVTSVQVQAKSTWSCFQ